MRRFVTGAFCLLATAVLLPLVFPDHAPMVWLPGCALLLTLLAVRWRLDHEARAPSEEPDADDRSESLRRWLSRTTTLIDRSESSRTDWDRHLRPMLAKQFELAARQRKSRDPAAFDATGQMHFGADLWEWVNPDNVARGGASRPGPGRATLNDVLQRLEQI